MAAAVATAVVTAIGATGATAAVVSIGVHVAVAFALSAVGSLLAPEPKKAPSSSDLHSRTQQINEPASPRQVVYGEVRLSGQVGYFGDTDGNAFLHIVIIVSTHEVEAIETVWLNDTPIFSDYLDASGSVVEGKFINRVRLKKHLGMDGQVADSDFVSEVSEATSSDRWQGMAYLYVRLERDTNLFPNGTPNISMRVKGKQVHDTRTSTSLWNPNPALCYRDYLTNARYGRNISTSRIIDSDFTSAANTCEEMVDVKTVTRNISSVSASEDLITLTGIDILDFQTGDRVKLATTGSAPGGLSTGTNYFIIVNHEESPIEVKLATTYANSLAGVAKNITSAGSGTMTLTKNAEPRYTCNGAFSTDTEPHSIIKSIMSSMAGKVVLPGTNYGLKPGAWSTPTISFDEDDVIEGVEFLTRHSRRERFNTLIGNYVSPQNKWEPVDYPAVTDSTYKADDNNVELLSTMNLPFTSRSQTAQRIAQIKLREHRREGRLMTTMKLTALQLKPGDTFFFTHDNFSFSSKTFEMQTMRLELDDDNGVPFYKVAVEAVETDSGVYDFDETTEESDVIPPRTVNTPDFTTVGIPGNPAVAESLYITRDGAGVKVRAELSWAASDDQFVEFYQVEHKLTTDSEYIVHPRTENTSFEINDIAPGTYDFRVKAINIREAASAYASTQSEIYGLLDPPADITGASVSVVSSLAVLRWDRHPDLDVKIGGKIHIRFAPVVKASASWASSYSIIKAVNGTVDQAVAPLREGTYLLKAEDSSGILSVNATKIESFEADLQPFSALSTIQEQPNFSGTLSGTYVTDDDKLSITASGLFDDIPDFDAISGLDSYGGVNSSGTYTFASGYDAGSQDRFRVEAILKTTAVNVQDKIDDRTNNVDTWEDFDGTAGANVDAKIEVRTTNDDPTGSPTWDDWQRVDLADFYKRAIEARCILTTDDPAYNNRAEEVGVKVTQL